MLKKFSSDHRGLDAACYLARSAMRQPAYFQKQAADDGILGSLGSLAAPVMEHVGKMGKGIGDVFGSAQPMHQVMMAGGGGLALYQLIRHLFGKRDENSGGMGGPMLGIGGLLAALYGAGHGDLGKILPNLQKMIGMGSGGPAEAPKAPPGAADAQLAAKGGVEGANKAIAPPQTQPGPAAKPPEKVEPAAAKAGPAEAKAEDKSENGSMPWGLGLGAAGLGAGTFGALGLSSLRGKKPAGDMPSAIPMGPDAVGRNAADALNTAVKRPIPTDSGVRLVVDKPKSVLPSGSAARVAKPTYKGKW